MTALKKDMAMNKSVYTHANEGTVRSRNKQYLELANKVSNLCANYPAEEDKMKYLRKVACRNVPN